ncbi:TonB-dependent siderophore receptor [Herbaspirillum sp. alder98]|uniref:TonB-dependent siderophore receptor n=1 Tax=Herbaspirillum sp. alder98 TaxID=2913096 RepID=UPI001CD81C9B|nr:TonB-dependent receptor [Herbaspirillum sp. alder98]MCA1323448.1 TonB-dependent receptor [Herbaspirillum sp. alder98]
MASSQFSRADQRRGRRPAQHHQQRTARLSRKPMALVVQAAFVSLAGMALLPETAHAQIQPPTSRESVRLYQISGGSLSAVLSRFAGQAGVALSFDPGLVDGIDSPGLSGNYAVAAGFSALLNGTGLEAVRHNDADFTVRRVVTVGQQGAALPLVTVAASGEPSAVTQGSGSYAAKVVTVGKGLHALKDIPQSVTVVTRQQMDDQNLNSIDDVLANSTGITMYDSPMGGRYVFSRGFRVDTYQFDGVQRAFYYPQANNFTSASTTLDRVEIVRGATGLLQGAGNPGAAINMVRKRPTADKQLEVMASVGSWNNRRGMIDASGPLNEEGSLRGRVVAGYNDRDYFYDKAKRETGVLYGVMEYDFSPQTRLTAGLSVETLRALPSFQGLPRYSNGNDIGLPRSTSLAADWNRWHGQQTATFAELQHKFSADWSAKVTANLTRETNDIKYAFPSGAIDPVLLNGTAMYAGLFDLETENKSLDVSVDGKFDLFGRRHGINLGASYSEMKSDSVYYLSMLGVTTNVFNPGPLAEPANAQIIGSAYRSDNSLVKMKQSGAYGVLRFSLSEPLTLVLGNRISWYDMSAQSRVTGTSSQDPYKESAVSTPYGGLIYKLTPQWSAYVSYADTFNPQSQRTADGTLLAPVTGKNYEAGIKGELFDGRLNASVAVYRYDQNNMAEQDLVNPCRASTYCYISRGAVRSRGLDAEINGELARGLQVAAGYTFSNQRYLDDTTKTNVDYSSTYTPKHMLRVWSDYRLPGDLQAWSVGGGVNYQTSNSRTTGLITLRQNSYAVWSARVGYQVDRNWSLALNVANLFDKRYYQTVGAPGWGNFYGDPRNATLSLRGKF